MTAPQLLAIDQGTTSTRAIVFTADGKARAAASAPLRQSYPQEGWVEHDSEEIWAGVLSTTREALNEAGAVAALGLTNQRETVIVWDRTTGAPLYPAIVWQDRRTASRCAALKEEGHEPAMARTTGLLIDPYFSATKIAWILDHVDGARARAEAGDLAAGTVDSFLLWRLTGGAHLTDATNASRTGLMDLERQAWDEGLCALFDVPPGILPQIVDCAGDFGRTKKDLFGEAIPICGVAGDQQAAAIGQACFTPGMAKATYGTGCFVLMNTGEGIVRSQHRLLSTVAYRLAGKPAYSVEGSIFIAGAAVQWLRDELGLLSAASETAERAGRAAADSQVVMVPAFAGMGAPHWDPGARGAVFGMTRATGPDELARAALEGVIYQTCDLLSAMAADGLSPEAVRVDGGMAANDWFVSRLSDLIDRPVDRPAVLETTALGAAFLAGLGAGVYGSLEEIAGLWPKDRRMTPSLDPEDRERQLRRWRACVKAVLDVASVS